MEQAQQCKDALAALRASMTDPVVAIDLEWKPEVFQGQFNKVRTELLLLLRPPLLTAALCCVGNN